ncbi:MAG: sulfatase family protein, partial [Planctomycetota bacterium]
MRNAFKALVPVVVAVVFHPCRAVLARANEAKRPNVIMINIDNHDRTVLGFAGSKFLETPNIDRLKREGVYFSNYRCASRCGPSRAALLTGRYSIRSGHIQTHDGRNVMGTNAPTVGRLFQNAGYKTAMFGKWHVGWN